jgi:outer membrane protein assembly factor BamB
MRRFMLMLTGVVVLAGMSLGVPAAAAGAGDWGQAGADAGWSQYQPATGGLTQARAAALDVSWNWPVPDAPTGAVLSGGMLLVSTSGGTVQWRDPATGRLLGRLTVAGRQVDQIAASAGTVYVRSTGPFNHGHYLAAYASRGGLRWEVALPPDDGISPFVLDRGRIALNTGPTCHDACTAYDVRVYAADTGVLRWRAPTGGDARFEPPAIAGDTLYQEAEVPIAGAAVLPSLIAYDVATGSRRWMRTAGPGTAVRGGAVVTGGTGGLCAFRATTGASRWCFRSPGRTFGRVSLSPSLVVTSDVTRPELLGVNGDGRLRWWDRFSRGAYRAEIASPPVTGAGVVYALVEHFDADNDRVLAELVAVQAATGRVLRRLPMPTDLGVPAQLLLGAGHLYLISSTGVLAIG